MFHEKYLYFVFSSLTVFVFHAKSLYFVFFLLYHTKSFLCNCPPCHDDEPPQDNLFGVFWIFINFLKQVMTSFGWSPSEEELKDMVNVIDQVGGLKRPKVNIKHFRVQCFVIPYLLDQDGDGDINFHEFVWLMTRSGNNK